LKNYPETVKVLRLRNTYLLSHLRDVACCSHSLGSALPLCSSLAKAAFITEAFFPLIMPGCKILYLSVIFFSFYRRIIGQYIKILIVPITTPPLCVGYNMAFCNRDRLD